MFDSDEAIEYLQTVRDFIRWGASRMSEAELSFGHGTTDALDEAAALVLYALHMPPDLDAEYFSAVLTLNERRTVTRLLERRVRERRPASYITNRAWFMGLPFYVDERVLIPRSPIAELIERQFAPWLDAERVNAVLDLCTGSGCIGIACAYAFPGASIDLVDISAEATEVARINVVDHGLQHRSEVIQSDLFTKLTHRRYDLIVSNPPYVRLSEMAQLPDEYHHEPNIGLEAGERGLDVVSRMLRMAGDHLREHGVLVVEVGDAQHDLEEVFPEVPFTWLDLTQGGKGVFLLTAKQIWSCQDMLG